MTDAERIGALETGREAIFAVRVAYCKMTNDLLLSAAMPGGWRQKLDDIGASIAAARVAIDAAVVLFQPTKLADPVARAEKAEAQVKALQEEVERQKNSCEVNRRGWLSEGDRANGLLSRAQHAEGEVSKWMRDFQEAHGEVARLKVEADANTWVYKESEIVKLKAEVTRLRETADVAMRRTLSAEAELRVSRKQYDAAECRRLDGLRRESQNAAETTLLRKLCGEASESLNDYHNRGVPFSESRHALVVRLREAAGVA